jgi:type VI protein secretion system component VasK
MKKSIEKHKKVIKDLEKNSPKDKKKLFTELRKRVEKLQKTLSSSKT